MHIYRCLHGDLYLASSVRYFSSVVIKLTDTDSFREEVFISSSFLRVSVYHDEEETAQFRMVKVCGGSYLHYSRPKNREQGRK